MGSSSFIYNSVLYSKYSLFKRDVLEPAKEEINKYSDIRIDYEPLKYDLSGVKHRGTSAIRFFITQVSVDINKPEPKSEYPSVMDILYGSGITEAQIVALVDMLMERLVPGRIPKQNIDPWACDIINHYWRKIQATPEKTKSTPYFRLISDINYDNDGKIEAYSMWEKKG